MPKQLTRPALAELRSLYAELGTAAAVGRRINVCENTAKRWLIDAGVQLRNGRPAANDDDLWEEEPEREPVAEPGTRPDNDELRRLYVDERMSHSAIGQRYGVTTDKAKYWCRQAGLIGARGNGHGNGTDTPTPARPAKRGATTATGRPIAQLDPIARAVVDGWLAGFRAHCARNRELVR